MRPWSCTRRGLPRGSPASSMRSTRARPAWTGTRTWRQLAEGTTAYLATDEVLAAMADTVTPQGILAVCGFLDVSLEQVLDAGPRLIAVLCQVRDPGNAGTVLAGRRCRRRRRRHPDRLQRGHLQPQGRPFDGGIPLPPARCPRRRGGGAGGPLQGTRHRRPRGGRPGPAEPGPAAGRERGPPPGGLRRRIGSTRWKTPRPGSSATRPRASPRKNSPWPTTGWRCRCTGPRRASTLAPPRRSASTRAPGPSRTARPGRSARCPGRATGHLA